MGKKVAKRRDGPSGRSSSGFAIILFAAAGSAAAILYREFTTSLPPVEKLLDYRPPVATRVFADDGTLIGEFYFEKRYLTPIYKIPQAGAARLRRRRGPELLPAHRRRLRRASSARR